ncbi:MAG TPA: peptidoglycan editing factor PgeF [Blastocatellia bacterium]|nr:peptidoglycan editing factor PgeF [Blastocatellia bacterium]
MNHFRLTACNDLLLVRIPSLERFGLVAATSTRVGGVSPLPENALNLGYFQGDLRENVEENRRRFLRALGAGTGNLFTLRQQHSDRLVVVEDGTTCASPPPEGDALVTARPGVLLGVLTADCLPILIFDARTRARAAVHAGWRGTLARIVEKTLDLMASRFGTRGHDCYVAIGPAIQKCCYEVGPEVIELFRREFPQTHVLSSARPSGKAHLDLIEATRAQLLARSVPPEQIYVCSLCTACHGELFFSYRREGRSNNHVGRMITVIGELNA